MGLIINTLKDPSSIVYLTGASNYTWFHYQNGTKVLLAKSLSYFEKLLPEYVRIHKTALINPTFLETLQHPPGHKMAGSVVLNGGVVLPVSRRRWGQVVQLLESWCMAPSLSVQSTLPASNGQRAGRNRQRAQAQAGPTLNAPSLRIYAHFDDPAKGGVLEQVIKKGWPNHQLRFFANPYELTETLHQAPLSQLPTIILLDVRGAASSGLSLLRTLKSDKRLLSIPIVLFSDFAGDNDVALGYELGASSIIKKSATLSDFAPTVERICRYWLTMVSLPGQRVARSNNPWKPAEAAYRK